jgi:hypothetical protein
MEPRPSSPFAFAKDAAGFVAILQPLWATLPSPEARAARLSSAARPFRAGGGRTSPSLRPGVGPGSPGPSISDLDVRALKTLYTPGGSGSGPGAGADRSASPASPTTTSGSTDGGGAGTGVFSVEAFAQRVQALISDDRALMERLIRFAQAHDLLKKNAERAQKLAQESNAALETYQRQVRTLEEHLARGDGWYVSATSLPTPIFFFFHSSFRDAELIVSCFSFFFSFWIGREKSSSLRRRSSHSNNARRSRPRRCGS